MWLGIHRIKALFSHFKWVWIGLPRHAQSYADIESALSQE